MLARYITGGALTLLGANLLVVGLGFINGPFLFLSPLRYPLVEMQMFTLIAGSSALVLGLVVLAAARLKAVSQSSN